MNIKAIAFFCLVVTALLTAVASGDATASIAAKVNLYLDLTHDQGGRSIPAGYSISNTTLRFGQVEVCTVVTQLIHIEWPSPPGSENGQTAIFISSLSSDESLTSFIGGVVMNDGVRSSTSVNIHFHPQSVSIVEPAAVVIFVGNLVAFRLAVYGQGTPSRHQQEPFITGPRATVLSPHQLWFRTISVWNPTSQPYYIHSFESTNPSLRVMFVDQHDQVDPQRRNWIVPPSTTAATILGSVSFMRTDEATVDGFLFLRTRGGPTFAHYYNFSVQVPKPRVVGLGTHVVYLTSYEDGSTSGMQSIFQGLATEERQILAARHRVGEIVLAPIELFNYQVTPLKIRDAIIRRASPLTATTISMKSRRGSESVGSNLPHVRHSRFKVSDTYDTLATQYAPCLRLIPQFGVVIPPNTRGVAAVAVLNLTKCLLSPIANESNPTFRSAQRITADVQLILAEKEYAQRMMDLSVSAWAVAGGIFPARRRGKSSAIHLIEGPLTVALPTAASTTIEPLEAVAVNSFGFSMKGIAPSFASTGMNGLVFVASADSSSRPTPPGGAVTAGTIEFNVTELRSTAPRVGDFPLAVLKLSVPVQPTGPVSCTTSLAGCTPELFEVDIPVVVMRMPFLLTQNDVDHEQHLATTTDCDTELLQYVHPASRIASCNKFLHVSSLHFGFHQVRDIAQRARAQSTLRSSPPLLVQTISISIVNPHNVTVHVKDIILSSNLLENNNKRKHFVRISEVTLAALNFEGDPLPVQVVGALAPGATVALDVQLMCNSAAAQDCASNGLVTGSLSFVAWVKLPGRQPAVMDVPPVTVQFSIIDDARGVLLPPPLFEWSDRKLVVNPVNGMEVIVIERNVTIHSFLTVETPLPKLVCLHLHASAAPHESFEVVWQRPTLPAGYFEGYVATIHYFPTKEIRLVAGSLQSTLAHRDAPSGMLAMATGVDQQQRTLPKHGALMPMSPYIQEEEVDQFAHHVAEHSAIEHAVATFFPFHPSRLKLESPEGASDSQSGWVTTFSGQSGLPTLLTGVVDFGSVSQVGKPASDASAPPRAVFVRVVNSQPTSVMIQPLLWSVAGSKLSHIGRMSIRDSVQKAFSSFRAGGESSEQRERAATFRIPNEVWESPSTTFTLAGNASTVVVIPRFSRVVIGPIYYQPNQQSLRASHRVVDRDVLLLRNNLSGIDAVLMVAKIGRPVVHIGDLSRTKWAAEVTDEREAAPLSGDALRDNASSLHHLWMNVSEAEVASWHPRPTGLPLLPEVLCHYLYAGSHLHTESLRALGVPESELGIDKLRGIVVRDEFSFDGSIRFPTAVNSSEQRREFVINARRPLHFKKSFQIINKGSFLLNLSSIGLGKSGACVEGEFLIYPCIATTTASDSEGQATTPNEVSTLAAVLGLPSIPSSAYLIVPPRHSVTIYVYRFPRFFLREVHTTIALTHSGGVVAMEFPFSSTLPDFQFYEMRLTSLKWFVASFQHAVVSTALTLIILYWTVMVTVHVWLASPATQPRPASMPPASTPTSSLPTALPKVPSTWESQKSGVTRAQALAAKKARTDAWELYRSQQRLRHTAASGESPPADEEPQPEDECINTPTPTPSSRSTSRASTPDSREPTTGHTTLSSASNVSANANNNAYTSQRRLRQIRRAQLEVIEAEQQDRDRLITEQLAFVGRTLLDWNGSVEVQKEVERRAAMLKMEAERKAAEAAAAALAAEQNRLENESRKREAETRRRIAEEKVRQHDLELAAKKNQSAQAVAAIPGAEAAATELQARQVQERKEAERRSIESEVEEAKAEERRRRLMDEERKRRTPQKISPPVHQGSAVTPTIVSPQPLNFGAGQNRGPAPVPPVAAGATPSPQQKRVNDIQIPLPRRAMLMTAPIAIDHEGDERVTAATASDQSYAEVQQLLQRALDSTVGGLSPGKTTLRQRLEAQHVAPLPFALPIASAQAPPTIDDPQRHNRELPMSPDLTRRLPSDFPFEEPHVQTTTAASVGDYDAFFGGGFAANPASVAAHSPEALVFEAESSPVTLGANFPVLDGGVWGFPASQERNPNSDPQPSGFTLFGGKW